MLHELGACNLAVEVVAGLRATPAVCTRLADLTTLFNMQSVSGDARYRPDPWLRRRGVIGPSLTHEEP